ncbi:hypothetical protein J6590_064720 [Homalodisca vitripennis]|nr:hypothetical protein J6590_064720 [Homalodisca vitripennis]
MKDTEDISLFLAPSGWVEEYAFVNVIAITVAFDTPALEVGVGVVTGSEECGDLLRWNLVSAHECVRCTATRAAEFTGREYRAVAYRASTLVLYCTVQVYVGRGYPVISYTNLSSTTSVCGERPLVLQSSRAVYVGRGYPVISYTNLSSTTSVCGERPLVLQSSRAVYVGRGYPVISYTNLSSTTSVCGERPLVLQSSRAVSIVLRLTVPPHLYCTVQVYVG